MSNYGPGEMWLAPAGTRATTKAWILAPGVEMNAVDVPDHEKQLAWAEFLGDYYRRLAVALADVVTLQQLQACAAAVVAQTKQ